jgi:hypothetical protein
MQNVHLVAAFMASVSLFMAMPLWWR